jgi:anti-sigma factor RsiW
VPAADRHIDDDDLERYVLDQLSEDAAAPIDEHLVVCQECQDRLAQTDQRVQAMRTALRRLG